MILLILNLWERFYLLNKKKKQTQTNYLKCFINGRWDFTKRTFI